MLIPQLFASDQTVSIDCTSIVCSTAKTPKLEGVKTKTNKSSNKTEVRLFVLKTSLFNSLAAA